jgi:hypothetical protein
MPKARSKDFATPEPGEAIKAAEVKRLAEAVARLEERTVDAGSGGSTLAPLDTERQMMTYVLMESDFKNITRLNAWSIFCFSLGAIFLSVFISIMTGLIFSQPLSPDMTQLVRLATHVTGWGWAICYAVGGWFWWRKNQDITEIKNEHKVKQHIET